MKVWKGDSTFGDKKGHVLNHLVRGSGQAQISSQTSIKYRWEVNFSNVCLKTTFGTCVFNFQFFVVKFLGEALLFSLTEILSCFCQFLSPKSWGLMQFLITNICIIKVQTKTHLPFFIAIKVASFTTKLGMEVLHYDSKWVALAGLKIRSDCKMM